MFEFSFGFGFPCLAFVEINLNQSSHKPHPHVCRAAAPLDTHAFVLVLGELGLILNRRGDLAILLT